MLATATLGSVATSELLASRPKNSRKHAWRNAFQVPPSFNQLKFNQFKPALTKTWTNVAEKIEDKFLEDKVVHGQVDGPLVYHLSRHDRWLLKQVKFTEKAIWACPLGGQWYMETCRALVDLVTLGLFEISRSTAGHAYHWGFVARARLPEGMIPGWRQEADSKNPSPYVYLVTQDRRLSQHLDGPKAKKRGAMTRFSIHLAKDPYEAAQILGFGRRGFVKFPLTAYGKNPRLDLERAWRPTKEPRDFDEIVALLKANPCTKKRYSLDRNNCQHYASYLYHDRDNMKGKRVAIKKRGNPHCI